MYDFVGIGALNLDYILTRAKQERFLSDTERREAPDKFELGTETEVDRPAIDRLLSDYDRHAFKLCLGGSAFNTTLALAHLQLGFRLAYVGVAGEASRPRSPAHPHFRRSLDMLGVDTRLIAERPNREPGLCVSYISRQGERALYTCPGANDDAYDHLKKEYTQIVNCLSSTRLVHITSLLDHRVLPVLERLLGDAKRENPNIIVTFDPGYPWAADLPLQIQPLIRLSDYLIVTQRELLALGKHLSAKDPSTRRQQLQSSWGDNPCLIALQDYAAAHITFKLRDKLRLRQLPGPELATTNIEDSTGAGDVFAAGLIAALLTRGLGPRDGVKLGLALVHEKLQEAGLPKRERFPRILDAIADDIDVAADKPKAVARTKPRLSFGWDHVFFDGKSQNRTDPWRMLEYCIWRKEPVKWYEGYLVYPDWRIAQRHRGPPSRSTFRQKVASDKWELNKANVAVDLRKDTDRRANEWSLQVPYRTGIDDASESYQRARELFDAEDFREARDELNRAIEAHPRHLESHLLLVECYTMLADAGYEEDLALDWETTYNVLGEWRSAIEFVREKAQHQQGDEFERLWLLLQSDERFSVIDARLEVFVKIVAKKGFSRDIVAISDLHRLLRTLASTSDDGLREEKCRELTAWPAVKEIMDEMPENQAALWYLLILDADGMPNKRLQSMANARYTNLEEFGTHLRKVLRSVLADVSDRAYVSGDDLVVSQNLRRKVRDLSSLAKELKGRSGVEPLDGELIDEARTRWGWNSAETSAILAFRGVHRQFGMDVESVPDNGRSESGLTE